MKKWFFPIILLIPMLMMSACSFINLLPRGNPVLHVITANEKDNSDKNYYAVYSNGTYCKTEPFEPDDVIAYHVEPHSTFSDEIVGNRIVNTVARPTVTDQNNTLISPDENILGIIYAAAKTIHHPIWDFEIVEDKGRYFAFVWLNVNWRSPCELYEYATENKTIHQLCEWNEVKIAGIAVPNSTKNHRKICDI